MEPNSPFIAKKLSNLIRKGFSKSKLVLDDIQFLMKRGRVMGKALNEASLSCRSRDDVHVPFVSPMEYEFSCRTSPSHQAYVPFRDRKRKSGRYRHYNARYSRTRDGTVLGRCRDAGDYESPLPKALVIPKGRTRVHISRESPLVLNKDHEDHDDEYRVDQAAEEFIQSFYTQLRLQKWLGVVDTADY